MPGYAGALNYAYHLDAAKLAAKLASHAVEKLGVLHLADTVTSVAVAGDRITALETAANGTIEGDLFIDCSGLRAVLIGDALKVEWEDLSRELLNDRAIPVQLPTDPAAPVASQTVATAHSAGWIWDIALPTRRGIGVVYSSQYCSDDQATGDAPILRLGDRSDRGCRRTDAADHRLPQRASPRFLEG